MVGKLFDWLDHRTGFRKLMDAMLLEHIPGGARWRYVWGSCLSFVFMIQLVTGIMLMWSYSPGDSTAWGSVYFIQYEMDFGWFIRGLHHFGSQTMVVLLAIHMLQVVLAGAQLPPREFNWWLGMGLLSVVLGLSLTGYLLPWDQKGYFATQVSTNIMGKVPILGEFLQRILVGGPEYGHATLTHFYALHVGILPPTLIALVIAHLAVFRRHGVTAPANAQGAEYFWPAQAFRDLIACLAVFGVMLALVLSGHGNEIPDHPNAVAADAGLYEQWAKAGRKGLGADLDAPADRLTPGYPARPEWYFLFLFQLLKYFEGDQEIIGTFVIPNSIMGFLFLLPLFGYGGMRKFGHAVGVLAIVGLLACVGGLTFLAMEDDAPKALLVTRDKHKEDAAQKFNEDLAEAKKLAARAVQLAAHGIPETGARELLRNDPLTKGPKLFEMNCAGCHKPAPSKDKPGAAPDLTDYGSYKWVRGLLTDPGDVKYFGFEKSKLKKMIEWREGIDEIRNGWKANESKEIADKKTREEDAEFDLIAKMLADQKNPKETRDEGLVKLAQPKFQTYCSECHRLGEKGGTQGPDLTDYASQAWLRQMVMNPHAKNRFGNKNAMPAFRDLDGPGSEVLKNEFDELIEAKGSKAPSVVNLGDVQREIIIRWLTGDNRVVFGGQPISGPVLGKKN